MEKEDAHNLYDDLNDTIRQSDWTMSPPKHTQDGRRVSHYLCLTYTGDLRTDLVPMLPPNAMAILNDHGIKDNFITQRKVAPDTEAYREDEYERSRRYAETEHHEIIIDGPGYDTLPKTGEEKRQTRLAREIREALHLPGAERRAASALAANYETVGAILAASDDELREIDGIGPKTLEAIRDRRSPDLIDRLSDHEGSVLIVAENDHGTFEPLYPRHDAESINRTLINDL